jgi:NAD-dependent dihydropyrimidine dehydrogenase PreA subunit
MPALVDEAKCSGCAKCVETCPNGSITMVNEKAKISEECIDCGACTCDCPNQAITMS